MLGLLGRSTETVRIDGVTVHKRDRLRHFAYLPQGSYLPMDRTVDRSLRLIFGGQDALEVFTSDARARSLVRRRARSLSLGERRYVECLAALAVRKPIVLLDEPFAQIEPIYCEALRGLILGTAAAGRIVLVSDHLSTSLEKLRPRLLLIRNGTLKEVLDGAEGLRRNGYLPETATQ